MKAGEGAARFGIDSAFNVTDVNAFKNAGLSLEEIRSRFRLEIPDRFNMATATVARQARGALGETVALVCDDGKNPIRRFTYRDLDGLSNRSAAFLRARGVKAGDVIVVYAAQGLAAAIAPLAAYKLGAINAPLSLLYGPRTLEHALLDSGARTIVSQGDALARLRAAGVDLSRLSLIIAEDPRSDDEIAFEQTIAGDERAFEAADTLASDPALLLYTSGSTGLPKGILHAHRFLLGYLASVSLFYQLEMDERGMVLWTPSDWSWIAGIVNVMMTGWFFGHTVIAGQGRFDPRWAFDFLEKHRVTHTFLTPTALKRMAQEPEPRSRWPHLALRAIGTGGEPLPSAVVDWSERTLRVPINEFYGLTEVNHLIGNCQRLYKAKRGSMGKCYPGHHVTVVDENGHELPDGVSGEIVAREDDPTLFLGYWNQPERTEAMRVGPWVRTGDFGHRDADGYFWYEGRNDDLIKSAGYRIGPAEIEDVLLRHPAVAEAAVVGLPDPERGQRVAAFIRLAQGQHPGDDLAAKLKNFVKEQLAVYKYPREIHFLEDFPMTSTGKISRKELRQRAEGTAGHAVKAAGTRDETQSS